MCVCTCAALWALANAYNWVTPCIRLWCDSQPFRHPKYSLTVTYYLCGHTLLPPLTPSNHRSVLSPHSFAFSRTSYKQNHTMHPFESGLTSANAFKIQPHCCKHQYFVPSYCWIASHCMEAPQFIHQLKDIWVVSSLGWLWIKIKQL